MGDVVKREYRCTDHEHRAIYTLSYYQSANIVQDAVVVLNLRESSSPVHSSLVIVYSCHFTVKDNVEVKVGLCLIQNKPTCRKI